MNNFKNLGIGLHLLKGIEALGIMNPMPIQQEAIPHLLAGERDLIGLAQTGTGKTAAFGLPLIQRTDLSNSEIQTLVLSPTRELAIQIADDVKNYARYVDGFKVTTVYGGASIDAQIKELKQSPHMVVATPGRLHDLIRRRKIDISRIRFVVLDEADEMLNMGFEEDISAILSETPASKRTFLFSATMPKEVLNISGKYMDNPVEITIGRKNEGAENVSHYYYMVQAKNRYLALKRIADFFPDIYGIIFCRTRIETKEVAAKLMEDGYNVDALHGDLSQAQREYVMHRFRNRYLSMIVATDVAARGIDVDDLSHVINYNLPDELQIYTHRSGRTGRAGRKGVSIVIIHQKEQYKIKRIEKQLKRKFEHRPIPGGEEICGKQLFSLINKMEQVAVDEDQIGPYIEKIRKKLDWMDKEQLLKQFVALEFNRFLSYYKDAPDLNILESPTHEKKRRDKRKRDHVTYTRFLIRIGSRDKMTPVDLIGMINDYTGRNDIDVGKIEIFKSFTFFEVEHTYTDLVLNSFLNAELNKRKLDVQLATSKKNLAANEKNKKIMRMENRPDGRVKDSVKKKKKKKKVRNRRSES